MKEMGAVGANFLILHSAPGKLGWLSYPPFYLIFAQNHPVEHLPASLQRSSELNSQQFPGLISPVSPRFLFMLLLTRDAPSCPFPSDFFLPPPPPFLPHFVCLLSPLSSCKFIIVGEEDISLSPSWFF